MKARPDGLRYGFSQKKVCQSSRMGGVKKLIRRKNKKMKSKNPQLYLCIFFTICIYSLLVIRRKISYILIFSLITNCGDLFKLMYILPKYSPMMPSISINIPPINNKAAINDEYPKTIFGLQMRFTTMIIA